MTLMQVQAFLSWDGCIEMDKPLLERLMDFDNYYTLRLEAWSEIKRLRRLLAYGTDTCEYRRMRAANKALVDENNELKGRIKHLKATIDVLKE